MITIVSRAVGGCSLNGKEYVRDPKDRVIKFINDEQAIEYMKLNGCDDIKQNIEDGSVMLDHEELEPIRANNGVLVENYEKISPLRRDISIPGVYCISCGKTFALYSYSFMQPIGVDENGRPYYNNCGNC